MSYTSYLKSEHWRERRSEFIRKSDKKCYICRVPTDLNVHHKRYSRNGESILYREENRDLMILCKDCHSFIHKYHLEEIMSQGKCKKKILRDLALKNRNH